MDFLSNDWINMVQGKYSILIGYVKFEFPIIVAVILKVIAKLNPNVPTDTIRELLTPKKTLIPEVKP